MLIFSRQVFFGFFQKGGKLGEASDSVFVYNETVETFSVGK